MELPDDAGGKAAGAAGASGDDDGVRAIIVAMVGSIRRKSAAATPAISESASGCRRVRPRPRIGVDTERELDGVPVGVDAVDGAGVARARLP